VVRNATIGYSSAAARIGGILGSFVPVTARFFGSFPLWCSGESEFALV